MGNAKEVEDFAERLRALKERSGRSYGSLATRLHVSTSTLHRYCNGDAVPTDYAPVERFARLCGATPEELVALHRRWILADAAKRRARESAMSAPRGGEDAADGPATDGTARRMDARSGGGEPRQSADVRGADAASNASGTTAAPAAPPAADRRQGRVTTPGPGPVTDPQRDAATSTRPEAGAGSRDAQPGAAADERHDTAAPADASRAAPMPDAHPAARRASAAADPASGRPGDDDGPDRSAQTHRTAHRGAAAHPDGDPHQRADANDRADRTLADGTHTQLSGAATAEAEPPAPGQAQPPRPWSPATGRADATDRADRSRPQAPAAPTATGKAQAERTATGKTGPAATGKAQPPPAKRARLRAVAANATDTATALRARRPWALLAGAAAVVVLAVTAVEVRPPGDDGRKDTAAVPPSAAPTSTPPAGSTARGHLDRQKTDGDEESGAPGGDDNKGERGKERGAKGDASGSPTPGATKGTDHGGSTQVPLTLSTRSHVWENGCGHRYLIDRPPTRVAPPPTEQDAPTWAAAHDAVHGGTTNVEVTVQGRASSAVVLQALHVRVVGRRTPLAWSSFAMDNGCGGSLTPRAFSVNLDAARPLARPTDGNDAGEPIPAVHFPYRVSASDPEVLLVNARTAGCDCSWYLELDWSSGGRSGTVRIDDRGSPFRTSSVKGRPAYAYDYADGTWHKSD
ncbi:helix-turn-helix domain-containing protein [Streptomyces rapamycinicus]|uniref:Transcriptional regulator with XRE-family HTH domain n=2 Tax=Streptomyces rapamycinicus TaxID=1226757 RepID=A0ABR6LGA8_9ACTN|nr:helix-turn-helix transcriptional regulator [Streptomyces rapamycinicus]MBB4781385.1 transcriptional regulator with XRE-family HTH domain [Streptomyces rapamycinicus]UTO62007.1 helix-turn-helix domain-containing protein [Streptomyces rapamycinicus]UTP29959.1 helix-turn-helix domain-containing protein [Streptomyces rapamycinicus NRRL 5491]